MGLNAAAACKPPVASKVGCAARSASGIRVRVLREKLAKRKVPLKNLDESKVEEGSLGRARQTIAFKQGIDQETGKKISKDIRGEGFKKVQVQIQGDELRVIAPSRDTLQEVMAYLREQDYGIELNFGNYR